MIKDEMKNAPKNRGIKYLECGKIKLQKKYHNRKYLRHSDW